MSERTFGIEFEFGTNLLSSDDYSEYGDYDGEDYGDGCWEEDVALPNAENILSRAGIPARSVYSNKVYRPYVNWGLSLDCGGLELKTPICNSHSWPHIHEVMQKVNNLLDTHTGTNWGTHVHIGSEDISPSNFLVLWAGLESLLFQLVSPHRRHSGWCAAIVQHSWSWDNIRRQALSSVEFSSQLPFKQAISFSGFGTIECRMHECTTNTQFLLPWVQMLRALGDFAASSAGALQLVDLVEDTPQDELLKLIIENSYTPAESDAILDGIRKRAHKYGVSNLFTCK